MNEWMIYQVKVLNVFGREIFTEKEAFEKVFLTLCDETKMK